MRLLLWLLWYGGWLVLPVSGVFGADSLVVLANETGPIRLNRAVGVLEDPTGTRSFADVRRATDFRPHQPGTFNFGGSASVYWLRFSLESRTADPKTSWLLELNDPLIDRTDLYVVHDDGRVVQQKNGDLRPFRQRGYPERYQVFALGLEPGRRLTAYLRVSGYGARHFDLNAWNEVDYLTFLTGENMEIGAYLGLLFIVLLYSLFLFFFLRDRTFLIYAVYLLALMALQYFICGFGSRWLLPDAPALANAMPNFLIGVCILMGTLFTMDFLEIRKRYPVLRYGYLLLVGLGVLIMAGAFSYSFLTSKLTDVLMLLSAGLALGFSLYVYRQGHPLAPYHLLSWAAVLVALLISGLHNAGLIPGNRLIDKLTMYASAVSVALLSIGLGVRLNAFRREKKEAQQRFLQQMQENERIRTRIARDLHDDVGSSLASIVLLAEAAGQQDAAQATALQPLLNRIQTNAQKVLEGMSDIVWTAQTHQDQFESVIVRIREFAAELLDSRQLPYRIDVDPDTRTLSLPGGYVYDIYLIFKESLHNVVKYAGATHVVISVQLKGDHLELCVEDNGQGFSPEQQLPTGDGNGLRNMRRRAAQLGGTIDILSEPARGTTICLRVPLDRFGKVPLSPPGG